MKKNEVVIAAYKRSAFGAFMGALSTLPITEVATTVAREVLKGFGVLPAPIDQVILGQVLSAGVGQAPSRQVAIKSGLDKGTPAIGVNKVCASGMKALDFAFQSILLGESRAVLAGGMESMSLVPHYTQLRSGKKLGDDLFLDGLLWDGLRDVYSGQMMGVFAEKCASDHAISKQAQDDYALKSYQRALKAQEKGFLKDEITPIVLKKREGEVIFSTDESPHQFDETKIKTLPTVFKKEGGSVTAFNASSMNDGAALLVVTTLEAAEKWGFSPLAKIVAFVDAAQEPADFTTAPALAIDKLLKKTNLTLSQIDFMEINEAFSVVPLANSKLLGYPLEQINIWGGAVSIGHPLGASGARITGTLARILLKEKAKKGIASICNGGGGATAVLLEVL